MKVTVLHSESDACAVVHVDSLVLTIARSSSHYEVLVEVDHDEDAPAVPVNIGNAVGDSVWWDL